MLFYKTILKVFLLLIFINSISSNLNGQDCIDYPDIIGDPCKNCAPPGWIETNIFLIYTHIIVPINGPLPETSCTLNNVSGPSPSGGNVVALFGTWDWEDLTTIETTITGLNTNTSYVFGIYWEEITASCAINNYVGGGILQIEIDGELYEFSGATEWELAEVCFTPTSSSVDIIISTDPPDSPGDAAIVIDGNFDCSLASPCCTLTPSISQDSYSVCSEETIVLDAEYIGEEGAVQIEWTCDPPEGLNYLSATNVISPEFTFPAPPLDYEGGIYKFSLSVEDDICVETIECIEVVIQPSIVATFDFELCDLDLIAELPTESDNGYTGTWEGDTNIEFSGGNFVLFTFILDDGQNNCIEPLEYEIFVNEGFTPTFVVDEEYCLSDDTYYILPAVSVEFVEGDWFPINEFNPAELGLGTYTYTFVPDDIYCATSYELTFGVVIGNSPSFNLPQEFCLEDDFFVLPQESMEGVSGTWSMDSIDLSIPIQDNVLVFIPDESSNCYGGYNYEYSVIQSITPLFDLPQSICREDVVISFDPISNQNIAGSWTPSEFNPDTVSTNSISAIWLPNNQDSCILSFEVNIPIMDKENINLELPDTLCEGDSTYVLPDIDSIAGAWNIDVIDLISNAGSSIIVEYIVEEDQCYENFSDTIFVTELEAPQFSIPETFCSNDASINLPETSDNFVQGTWNINPIDPSLQDSLVVIFTPNSGGCDDVFSQTLYFTEVMVPNFDLPMMMCENDAVFTFPNVSINGINGSWLESSVDPSMVNESTFSNTFTPDDDACTSTVSITIEILSFENVSVEVTDPTSCEAEDGSIQIVGASAEMELSTDEGMTWTMVADIDNLASGSYNIQLRYEALPSCSVVFTPQLNSPESPTIQELNATDPSACNQEDGSIECIADGNDLEYSTDNTTWQTSNVFENLSMGIYVVYVRKASDMGCVSSASVELEDPISMEICDGIDNDCNGEIDEDLSTENYYADKDMDGFGDANDLVNDCSQPQGYVLDDTDCDDNNPDIFPGADEVPDNGVDEDCDGADLTTSVHELAGQKIDIYPNPTNGFVTIEMKESKDVILSLYDMTGKCLIHQGQLNAIDLSEYSNGVYLIRITNQKSFESIVERIVLYK